MLSSAAAHYAASVRMRCLYTAPTVRTFASVALFTGDELMHAVMYAGVQVHYGMQLDQLLCTCKLASVKSIEPRVTVMLQFSAGKCTPLHLFRSYEECGYYQYIVLNEPYSKPSSKVTFSVRIFNIMVRKKV